MSDKVEGASYRHATDLIDGTMIAECPNGCQSWELKVGTSELFLDELVPDEFCECSVCGAEMDTIAQETPSEEFQ